ncbi:MAG: peptidoglycan DD-metalloendopeptidase family protein [Legionellaceae bacterium]|nr:peptidoglycan DD-metalloendopeptidase family protein [Legionellaceae bacterium]
MKYPFKSHINVLNRPQKIIALSLVCILFFFYCIFKLSNPASAPVTEQLLTLPDAVSQSIINEKPNDSSWQDIQTKPGDSLASLFTHMGLSAQDLKEVMHNNPHAKSLTQIKPNQVVKFLIINSKLEQIILPLSKMQYLVVKRLPDRFETQIKTHETYIKPETVTGTIHHSLYTTAKNTQIPYALIQQMADILAWQINFSKDLREGDQFTIHYEVYYVNNERIRTGNVLAVSYSNQGKIYRAIRHQTKTGKTDYYTPEGKSVRKAFSRYPIQFSHISSSFNLSRMHPILKKRRPHRGIDLAAPIGTPIHATSDGRISSIGYDSGYGNKIKISHSGPYESLYAHLLRFQKGLKRGDFVHRGDVIGYVGQTGLADGPHCHYEFRVNNQPKNPATVALPEALPIPSSELAAFQHHANTELAELERISQPTQDIT